MFDLSKYKPPGPVAAAFIRDDTSAVPAIMGPVGSGKTNAAIFKILRHVALMPKLRNGRIVAKGTAVRTDYRTLYKTTLSTWHQWFPKDYAKGNFVGGADRPAVHELVFTTPRGQIIDLTMEFQALGDKRIEDVMRGWEGSFGWLNEIDLLAQSALEFLQQRVPRFPRQADVADGATLRPLVIADLNPPGDPDHWIVKDFIDTPKAGYKLYQQPSGLAPDAENVANLPSGYYQRLAETMEPWNVQRFVYGKVGYDRSGLPVYPEFDERLNIAKTPLKPIPGQSIFIGMDAALHPAAVIGQRGPDLQLRIYEELYFDRVGPTRFGEMLAAALQERYRDSPVGYVFYDPSADYGADKEGGEQSWIDIVRKALGVPCLPAPSNEIALRVEAVRNLIVMPLTADKRALVVDPARCPMLIKGFMSHYRYKLNPDGNLVNAGTPRPEKNAHANVHDAAQYLCLGLLGRAGAIASAAKGFRPGTTTQHGAMNSVMKSGFKL
ncbi:MAG: hypothetical protein KGQ37_03745 [Hyphomicrobiales bacterium]|nr:hypothetical protein [Hyphomicrobiales bacterium]